MKYSETYKARISDYLGVQPYQISLYWKGRVGLYALLKAMGIKEGDEVILPAFTCVVVPNAIIYLNAVPKYVDIDSATLNTSLNTIKAAVTNKTKCIIIQNTFGLSNEVEEIVAFAKENNLLTVEDCTHGFGGLYNGKPNGTYCDAAFYSTQWNKPFSTGIGGFALLNNLAFQDALVELQKELVAPSKKDTYVLASLIQARKYLLHDSTYWTALKLYRSLSKSGLTLGSSKSEELVDSKIPKNYFMGSSSTQEKVGIQALADLNSVIERRRSNGKIYNDFMRKHGLWNYRDEDLKNHSFLNFPVLVKDKKGFRRKAEKAKVRLGDWFLSPIHPVLENFDRWMMDINDYPVAQKISNQIVNLPTDLTSTAKVIRFLEQNIDELL
jgi:perosamine synthetase